MLLILFKPYIQFKKFQAHKLLDAIKIIYKIFLKNIDYDKIVQLMFDIQFQNYKSGKRRSRGEIRKILGLTP